MIAAAPTADTNRPDRCTSCDGDAMSCTVKLALGGRRCCGECDHDGAMAS